MGIVISVQFIIFSLYMFYLFNRFYPNIGSISESYYLLKRKSWLFTIFMFAMGVTTCLMGTTILFVSGILFCFVGVATRFRDDMEGSIHYIGAAGGYAIACLAISPFITALLIAVSLVFNYLKVENKTLWLEIIGFYLIQLGLLIKLI